MPALEPVIKAVRPVNQELQDSRVISIVTPQQVDPAVKVVAEDHPDNQDLMQIKLKVEPQVLVMLRDLEETEEPGQTM